MAKPVWSRNPSGTGLVRGEAEMTAGKDRPFLCAGAATLNTKAK